MRYRGSCELYTVHPTLPLIAPLCGMEIKMKRILTFSNFTYNISILNVIQKISSSIPKSKTTIFGTRFKVSSNELAMLVLK